jgi:hypothetical protein
MSSEVQARFATRRDAELAIEHLVQQHGIDRAAITGRGARSEMRSVMIRGGRA